MIYSLMVAAKLRDEVVPKLITYADGLAEESGGAKEAARKIDQANRLLRDASAILVNELLTKKNED